MPKAPSRNAADLKNAIDDSTRSSGVGASPTRKAKARAGRKQTGRYAAKLLFEFRVMVDGLPAVRRTCEERIIVFPAPHGRAALREAKRRARAAQHRYKNNHGNPVHFEFVGVLELLRLDPVCESDEVWYDIVERVRPSERRTSIVPRERNLSAIRNCE
jgi:hypothetical protein